MKIKLGFLSSKQVLEESCGEVLNAELYNFRTSPPVPVPNGLMCQQIFGPIRDYQCMCGRFKGKQNKGVTCPVCQVTLLSSYSRTQRMGHIHLPFAVVHPLAVKWIAMLLGVTVKDLGKVIGGERAFGFVSDPLGPLVKDGQRGRVEILSLEDPDGETTCTGVYNFVSGINVKAIAEMDRSRSSDLRTKMLSSLLKNSNGDPRVYFVRDILVIPAEYRPLASIEGMWVSDTKNDLYGRILDRKRSLVDMLRFDPPELIIRTEQVLLQKAVNQLFVVGFQRRRTKYKSLTDTLAKKRGLLRGNLLGKRVDYSGRSVITVAPHLALDEAGIPKEMAYELFLPFIVGHLKARYGCGYKEAHRLYTERAPEAWTSLEDVTRDHRVLLNRHPTLHRLGIQAFKIVLHSGKSIQVNPLVCAGYNADFDGDQMGVHVPLTQEALEESKTLLDPASNLLKPLDGEPAMVPCHEMLLGLYIMTKIKMNGAPKKFKSLDSLRYLYEIGEVGVSDELLFFADGEWKSTCFGRLWIEEILGVPVDFVLDKSSIKELVSESFNRLSRAELVSALDRVRDIAFAQVTKSGVSLCIDDMVVPAAKEARFSAAEQYARKLESQEELPKEEVYELSIRNWLDVLKRLQEDFVNEAGDDNPLVMMLKTGARASMDQISQLSIAKGMISDLGGNILKNPVSRGYREGLDPFGYFLSTKGGRKGLADKKFATPKSGYLARRLVTVARDFYIVEGDCGTREGILILSSQAQGRFILENSGDGQVRVRSPVCCKSRGGICARCYGLDPTTRKLPVKHAAVGVIAGQALSEPTTQMTMRTFHIGGIAKLGTGPKVVKSAVGGRVSFDREIPGIFRVAVNDRRYYIHEFARLLVKDGDVIEEGAVLATYVTLGLKQEDVVGKIPLLELYYETRTPVIEAVVALTDGRIRLEYIRDKIVVRIGDKIQGSVFEQPMFVADGEHVKKGQFLSYGEANLKKLFKGSEGDLDLLAIVFVQRLLELYEEEGVKCCSVHLEMILRGLTELVIKPDHSYGLRSYEDGELTLVGPVESATKHPSWLKTIGFGWVKQNLSTAAGLGLTTYNLPSEKIFTGELLPRRDDKDVS